MIWRIFESVRSDINTIVFLVVEQKIFFDTATKMLTSWLCTVKICIEVIGIVEIV